MRLIRVSRSVQEQRLRAEQSREADMERTGADMGRIGPSLIGPSLTMPLLLHSIDPVLLLLLLLIDVVRLLLHLSSQMRQTEERTSEE
jgi:hypothetical protein